MTVRVNNIYALDLVIVINSSPSMQNKARALSKAADKIIKTGDFGNSSDLRVVWLGIEGTYQRTKFNQTVRQYLTTQIKVPESELHSRKRGELRNAGTQEDAARAIEDICTHFDWRKGSYRAILYLGNHALDSGGKKTEAKDIKAANFAIQKAQDACVIVHTYFASYTFKLQYQETIQREYARLSLETGGQAFTNKDASDGFTNILKKVISRSHFYQIASEKISEETEEVFSNHQAINQENMSILTIDTKNNCYVINPEQMNHLQRNVANSFTFGKGSFEIKITSGNYKYAKSNTAGEPFVLLWIYGVDGTKFVNENTGIEVSSSWITLNGYHDILKLEVKEKAVLCALFFDVNSTDNAGEINLSITSNKPFFNPQSLIVDSRKNCYILDEYYLSSLKQWNVNSIELNPGKYKIKIQEGNACYWSNNQKFQIEPWALMWIQNGKFITNLTGIEIQEGWYSLNGLNDEVILEVKEKTTVSGFFFDTYKEDNEGQIILTIDSMSVNDMTENNQNQQNNERTEEISVTTETVINEQNITVEISEESSSIEEMNFSGGSGGSFSSAGGGSFSSAVNFSFRFDEAQMEQMWQQMAAKIETSVTVIDEQDEKKEAYYWDNLEKWILKGYQTQAKSLAMQVARMEFMIKALTQQMESSFSQNFQFWSSHFDQRLNDLISTRISAVINQQVNLKIASQTQEIQNLVIQQMQTDIDQRINNVVNLKVANQTQEINNNVIQQLQTDIDQRIENVVNLKIANQTQEINNLLIQQIQADMEQRIENVVDLKIANQTQEINNLVIQQIQTDIDQRIENVVNLKIANQTQEINNLVIQQIQTDIDQRIDSVVNLKIANQTQNVKNLVIQQMQTDIDQRIENVINLKIPNQTQEINNLVIQQIHADIDQRIDSVVNLKIANQTQNVKNLVIQQMQTDIDQRIDSVVNLKIANQTQNVKNLVIQQMQTDIEQRINALVNQSADNSIQLVVNNVINDVDNRINVNIDNKILNFRNDVLSIINNEINQNFTQSITTTVLSDIKKQQFYLDMQSIKTEVQNFYARLGQFETQLYLRINQGDTQLYNWTLEQLVALQGCLTDRQALVELFESFSARLKNDLDKAPCVNPSRFTPWVGIGVHPQISPGQPQQLPGS